MSDDRQTTATVVIRSGSTTVEEVHDELRGHLSYRILVSAHAGPSAGVVQGIATFEPGQAEARHHHDVPETAHVLEGAGQLDLGTATHDLGVGDTVFLAPGAPHGWSGGDDGLRILFTFAADRWDEVDYHFSGGNSGDGTDAEP